MKLEVTAKQVRRDTLASIFHAKSGHPGGCLSCIDILVVLLKLGFFDNDPCKKFVLSKGHSAPALYAIGLQAGLIKRNDLRHLRKLGSKLQGHPDVTHTPWVLASTGSLGQGFSAAVGIALGHKFLKTECSVVSMLGDGELQEGQIWEGAMFSAHHNLNNLIAIIDYNKLQSDDLNSNVMNIEPVSEKWASFGWETIIINGHSFVEIEQGILTAKANLRSPTVIIANTVKGKGIEYMENSPLWHGSVTLREEELRSALSSLQTSEANIEAYLTGRIWE